MEPEKIGIIATIEAVTKEPEKFAFIIARKTARLIMEEILRKEQNAPGSLSGVDRMMLGSLRSVQLQKGNLKKYWDDQAQILEPMIINFIRERAGETIPGFHGDNTTREIAAHAALQLLSDKLERTNKKHALAHYIARHSTSHAQEADNRRKHSLHLLGDLDRLTLFDHGIVNVNPVSSPLLSDENPPRTVGSRLWMGHDTPTDYDGTDTSQNTNILVEMTEDKRVIRVIEGAHLTRQNDFVITTTDTSAQDMQQVVCYTDPILEPGTTSDYKTQIIHTANGNIGTYKSTRTSKVPYTDWTIVEVTGEKGSITIALNKSSLGESFETGNKVLKLDNNYFIVDEIAQEITIFARPKLIKINIIIDQSFGVHNNKFYFTDMTGTKKRMIFNQGNPEITDIAPEEEVFFQ